MTDEELARRMEEMLRQPPEPNDEGAGVPATK
jgi:hypothetical protein